VLEQADEQVQQVPSLNTSRIMDKRMGKGRYIL
jgi:hypothetical protein